MSRTCRGKSQGHVTKFQRHVAKIKSWDFAEELETADEEQLGRGRRKKKKTERLVEDATWGQNHAGLHEEVKLNIPTPKCKKKQNGTTMRLGR
jgi:hypothetical protein